MALRFHPGYKSGSVLESGHWVPITMELVAGSWAYLFDQFVFPSIGVINRPEITVPWLSLIPGVHHLALVCACRLEELNIVIWELWLELGDCRASRYGTSHNYHHGGLNRGLRTAATRVWDFGL